jgi:Integrase core domain
MGIRDRPISPQSPWQNGYAERLIGTLRRECLDQMVILGEVHLRRILSGYATYYNQTRTHLALQKDAPSNPTVRCHCRHSHLGRAASSIRQDVIFGKDRCWRGIARRSANRWSACISLLLWLRPLLLRWPYYGGCYRTICDSTPYGPRLRRVWVCE